MLELEARPALDLASPEIGEVHPLAEYKLFFTTLAAYHIAQSHPDNPVFDNLRKATAENKSAFLNAGLKPPPADFNLPPEYQDFQPFFDVFHRQNLPKMA